MNVIRQGQCLLLSFCLLSLALPAIAQTSSSQVGDPYQKWLNEDVHWIITDQERAHFNKLTTDQQRDDFVREFWEGRNPKPGAAENTFKEEHYRRLAYSNTHFAAGMPGYKSDRGHLYITFGKPDSIDSHPTLSPPTEVWHYAYIKGIGRNVVFTLSDECRCGDYTLAGGDRERIAPGTLDIGNPYPVN